MTESLFEGYLKDPNYMRLFQQERAIFEVTECIEAVMAELGISRSELAEKLGQSKSWVTQLLDGEKNKTIRTVADVFAVMGREYHSVQRPIQIQAEIKVAASSKQGGKSEDSTRQTISINEGLVRGRIEKSSDFSFALKKVM
jgi:transcriptional regulator with XRE-family HTH domain